MESRIYTVKNSYGTRLVRAINRSRALRHVASDYKVEVATQDELVEAIKLGIEVEQDKAPDQPEG
jgi:gamma-glutamyl-gamma-aminobutyrate hydrolase PuuD